MTKRRTVTLDGNEATASVAHRTNEVIAIYPITPSSTMGELADEWSAQGRVNIWGGVPQITEMQSEAGVAGAIHGALQAGALATTFTASQGLLLMIPTMYKLAGELLPFCLHVTARTVATHALSIFGDHSDVMACRQTGFAMLASGSVQEAHDLACIAQSATLRARVPFLHFFDGFRTSHEVAKIEELSDDDLRAMIDDRDISVHRQHALTPDRPTVRGSAQNPDTFFQAREAANPFYLNCTEIVRETMARFGRLTGRHYRPFNYFGHARPERVIVVMGSAAETVHETVDYLVGQGERVGVLKVRLYRPFSVADLLSELPASVTAVAVLDRTKEPGAIGEPLYQDVVTAIAEARMQGQLSGQPKIVIGGRYGLSSKEFTPAMVKAVFDELKRPAARLHFTVGINDDVTGLSLAYDADFDIEPNDITRALFFGLGADGTVGANKNSIKIIGEGTENWAQGYFVYDSKKSGAVTVSHLRFGASPIRSSYLISRANFIACHQWSFVGRLDLLEHADQGAVLLLNSPYGREEVWSHLPRELQQQIIEKQIRLFVIDAYKVARETGMGARINTVMQTCFFAVSGVLPREDAIARIKKAIKKSYTKKGDEVVKKNFAAVDTTLAGLYEVEVPTTINGPESTASLIPDHAPDFVKRVTAAIMAHKGDSLPVSAFPVDGSWPVGTSRWEKRNIALEIPVWDEALCIQCNKCAFVCPHAAIRVKAYEADLLAESPMTFKSVDYRSKDEHGLKYTVQVAPEDCTGCALCIAACPVKDKTDAQHRAINMAPQAPLLAAEHENYEFFLNLPDPDRATLRADVKGSQFMLPLFEYSGACAGCGETPYIKLLTQLFGDRAFIANATGCSSIYGGNLPTTPYTTGRDGRGPAWCNSLFEDNAEFGLGFRLAIDKHEEQARALLTRLCAELGEQLVNELLNADQSQEVGIEAQRARVAELKSRLAAIDSAPARHLMLVADYLVKKSVWLVGGDGWAYDIGFGGLDHVLSLGRKVNILVLDTEVYSNTGGQQSKATPIGAAARFASAGKAIPKKDLGLMAMTYGSAYIARIAFGANDSQTLQAFREADAYPGTSLIIAYSHCIAHGYDLSHGLEQQKLAVNSGYWPLYRFDPRRLSRGEAPLQLDSAAPKVSLSDYVRNEARYRVVEQQSAEHFKELMAAAEVEIAKRYALYRQLADMKLTTYRDREFKSEKSPSGAEFSPLLPWAQR